eukprot:403371096
MCLFPMGGGGFNMQPMVPPSQKGLVHKQRLYIVMAVHLVLSILYMFFNMMGGLFELFSVAILYCGTAQMNYCQLIIYMVIQGNKLVHTVATVGLLIQKGKFATVFQHSYSASYLIIMITFAIFYIIAITMCFYAYREFKGMMFDNGQETQGGLANLLGQRMMGSQGGGGQGNANNQNSNYQNQQQNQRQQQDTSIPLINRSRSPAPGSAPSTNTDNEQSSNQQTQSRNFRPFGGQGVRIGGNQ